MQHQGELDAAEAQYRALLADPPTAERRRWLQFNLGVIALERDDTTLARERFATVYQEAVRDEYGAKARYEVAQLAEEPTKRIDELLEVVRRYPDQANADFALADIVRQHRDAGRDAELQTLLVQLTADVADTEVADNVWFALAGVRRDAGDPDGALDAYRALFARHPRGALADDALWEMASIYRAHQLWEPALQLLTRIALDVESSWFVGSYDSDWVDNATYDIAWIHLVFRADYGEAQRWFRRYLRRYPDGLQADDAAWNLVEIHRLRGETDAYLSAMQAFLTEFPESRHVRRAAARLEES